MGKRDKTITAACPTEDGIEWTSVRVSQGEIEPLASGSQPWLPEDAGNEEALESVHLPEQLAEKLEGDITVPLRTSEMLMRVMPFPSADPDEVAGMVEFQIDKISPFSLDQLAIAHEILSTGEGQTLVLMAATRRKTVDAIGDRFEQQGIRIHSMDIRILGWLQLLRQQDAIPEQGCGVLVIHDDLDFCLTITLDGLPMAFRILHSDLDDMQIVEELVQEIGHTLTTLDLEHEVPTPESISFWTYREVPQSLADKLAELSGLRVECGSLHELPLLSEGVVQRSLELKKDRLELIPREWTEYVERQALRKKYSRYTVVIASLWLILLLIVTGIYQVRARKLAAIEKKAFDIELIANEALKNRQKLLRLQEYRDRSDSALECLREVTRLMPLGDIEFTSFNYSKKSGVTLRGTAADEDMVYDYWKTLAASDLFVRLRDQRVNSKTTRGAGRRAVFSVTLELPAEEEEDA